MIYINKKELESLFLHNIVVSQIYKGMTIIWEAIKSCFGAGFWKNDAPWSNNEGWKN